MKKLFCLFIAIFFLFVPLSVTYCAAEDETSFSAYTGFYTLPSITSFEVPTYIPTYPTEEYVEYEDYEQSDDPSDSMVPIFAIILFFIWSSFIYLLNKENKNKKKKKSSKGIDLCKCENGHFYNATEHPYCCPHCESEKIVRGSSEDCNPKYPEEFLREFRWDDNYMDIDKIVKIELTFGYFPLKNIIFEKNVMTYRNRINPRDGGMGFSKNFFDDHTVALKKEQTEELQRILKEANINQWKTSPWILEHIYVGSLGFHVEKTFKCVFENGYSFKWFSFENEDGFRALTNFFSKFYDEETDKETKATEKEERASEKTKKDNSNLASSFYDMKERIMKTELRNAEKIHQEPHKADNQSQSDSGIASFEYVTCENGHFCDTVKHPGTCPHCGSTQLTVMCVDRFDTK